MRAAASARGVSTAVLTSGLLTVESGRVDVMVRVVARGSCRQARERIRVLRERVEGVPELDPKGERTKTGSMVPGLKAGG